jgi:hypothetical protein
MRTKVEPRAEKTPEETDLELIGHLRHMGRNYEPTSAEGRLTDQAISRLRRLLKDEQTRDQLLQTVNRAQDIATGQLRLAQDAFEVLRDQIKFQKSLQSSQSTELLPPNGHGDRDEVAEDGKGE